MNRRLYGKLREIEESLEINDDPLGKRYDVNKHGLIVKGDIPILKDTRMRLLALLSIEGWSVAKVFGGHAVTHPDIGASALISVAGNTPLRGESCFTIVTF